MNVYVTKLLVCEIMGGARAMAAATGAVGLCESLSLAACTSAEFKKLFYTAATAPQYRHVLTSDHRIPWSGAAIENNHTEVVSGCGRHR